MMRPALLGGRRTREEMDIVHGVPLSLPKAVLAQLRNARGPIRFTDFAEQERPGENPEAFEESVIEDVEMPASQENEGAQPLSAVNRCLPRRKKTARRILEPTSVPAILGPSISEAGRKFDKMATVKRT